MAQKPLRPCRHPGCGALTREGWCPKHRPKPAKRRESEDWHWMYNTPEWRDLRAAQLLAEPFCRECARERRRTRATVVDHMVPHRGEWTLFRLPSNLQSLCKRHHDQKTMRELNERREKRSGF